MVISVIYGSYEKINNCLLIDIKRRYDVTQSLRKVCHVKLLLGNGTLCLSEK